MIVIFYAFGRELSVLKSRFAERRPLREDGLRGFSAKLGEVPVMALATGIGTLRAQETACRAFARIQRPKLAISTGVAGALSEDLAAGHMVIANRLIFSGGLGHGDCSVPIAADLVHQAERAMRGAGIRFATGAMLTADRVLNSSAEKHGASSKTGAIAVDMESAAIAVEARDRNIPFVCLRAILDAVDDEVVGPMPNADGRIDPIKAGMALLRNPAWLFRLPRMMRNLGHASKSLADAVEALSRELG